MKEAMKLSCFIGLLSYFTTKKSLLLWLPVINKLKAKWKERQWSRIMLWTRHEICVWWRLRRLQYRCWDDRRMIGRCLTWSGCWCQHQQLTDAARRIKERAAAWMTWRHRGIPSMTFRCHDDDKARSRTSFCCSWLWSATNAQHRITRASLKQAEHFWSKTAN